MRIIGLTGFARTGKNTVASLIAQRIESCRQAAFADLIKLSAARTLGVLRHPDDVGLGAVQHWADAFKLGHNLQITNDCGEVIHEVTGRQFLQRYGSEAHRDLFGDDFWVEAMDFTDDSDVLVITDVRFKNEARKIRSMGGEIWRVIRPGTRAGTHISEIALPDDLSDLELVNDGTIEELGDKVGTALELGRTFRTMEALIGSG